MDVDPAERLQRRRRTHDSVGVYMKFTYQGVTGLIFNEMPLEEHTVMSLEPIPTTKTCK